MNNYKSIEPINISLIPLVEDAPLTTRTNVETYYSEFNGNCVGQYHCPTDIITSLFGPDAILTYIENGDIDTKHIDIITFDSPNPKTATVAHELTHAYTEGYAREARGYAKLIKRMIEQPELKEKLNPIGEKLKKSIKDIPFEVMRELTTINEGIAYSVGRFYGDEYPENGYLFGPSREEILERMKPCEELISLLGIDGARAFVRNKMREMYTSGNLISLEKEIEEFKEGVSAFFTRLSNQTSLSKP